MTRIKFDSDGYYVDPPEQFLVVAHRRLRGIFGLCSVCKDVNGREGVYDRREDAAKDATRWNEQMTTGNVRYTVEALFAHR